MNMEPRIPPSRLERHARLLLRLVSTRLDRDPEIPLAPDDGLAPPVAGPKTPAKDAALMAEQYPDVKAAYDAHRYATVQERCGNHVEMKRVINERARKLDQLFLRAHPIQRSRCVTQCSHER